MKNTLITPKEWCHKFSQRDYQQKKEMMTLRRHLDSQLAEMEEQKAHLENILFDVDCTDAIGKDAIGKDAIGKDAIGRDAIGRDAINRVSAINMDAFRKLNLLNYKIECTIQRLKGEWKYGNHLECVETRLIK